MIRLGGERKLSRTPPTLNARIFKSIALDFKFGEFCKNVSGNNLE